MRGRARIQSVSLCLLVFSETQTPLLHPHPHASGVAECFLMFPILHPTLDQEPRKDPATCSVFLLRALGKAQHMGTWAEWSGLSEYS